MDHDPEGVPRDQRRDGVLRVHDVARAQAARPHAAALRPEPRRPQGPARADRRPAEADPQGGVRADRRPSEPLYIIAPVVSMFTALARVQRDPVRRRLDRLAATTSTARSSNVPISLILIFALGSIGIYGFIVGGWASDSKYSMLGSMRTCAQLVSYEVSLALSVLGVVLMGAVAEPAGDRRQAAGDALVLHPAVRRPASSSCSAASPRPRGRRSTCPRPTPSSSPATTPSTPACAGASSRRPSTST